MKMNNDAAKLLEAAYRELAWTEEQADKMIERAGELAQLDYCQLIKARHMLQAIGERNSELDRS